MKKLLKHKNNIAGIVFIIATILNIIYLRNLSHKFLCGFYTYSITDIMWFITGAILIFNFKKITPIVLIITGLTYFIKPTGCIGWTVLTAILGCLAALTLGLYELRLNFKKIKIIDSLWFIPLILYISHAIKFYNYSYYIPVLYLIGFMLICLHKKSINY